MNIPHLIKWFEENQREFPWRVLRTPYTVWVSEMMLQQTQASVVIPYFERWISRFPNLHDLATASLDEVIKLWEGLGYYSRARHLHEGARYLVQHCDSIFPEDPEKLAPIKGLGPYTLGAIRSFAFHHKVPAVDGNVMRVLSRYFGFQEDISKANSQNKLREMAASLLPNEKSWVVNEALIELGALICTKVPKCKRCPFRSNCKAYASGMTDKLPIKSAKVKVTPLYRAVLLFKSSDLFLVKRGSSGKIMADLHEFPYVELSSKEIEHGEIYKEIQKHFSCEVSFEERLPEVCHSFTRYRAFLFPLLFQCTRPFEVSAPYSWQKKSSLPHLAFSSGHRRIMLNFIGHLNDFPA